MKRKKYAVIGSGRLGLLVASRLPVGHDIILWGRDPIKVFQAVCNMPNAVGTSEAKNLEDADIVFLALPAEITIEVASAMMSFIPDEAIIINLATNLFLEDIKKAWPGRQHLASVTIMGSVRNIQVGLPPLIVGQCMGRDFSKIACIFSKIGPIIIGNERAAAKLNRIAVETGIKAGMSLLELADAEEDISKEMAEAAVINVCSGAIRGVCEGGIGSFAKGILKNQ